MPYATTEAISAIYPVKTINSTDRRMDHKEINLDLSQVSGINEYAVDYSKFGEDYIFSHITSDALIRQSEIRSLIRFNALTMMLCLDGRLQLEIDGAPYDVKKDMIVLLGPETTARLIDKADDLDAYILFFSPQFLREINIDINAIDNRFIATRPRPVIELTADESQLLQGLMDVMHRNASIGDNKVTEAYSKNISRNIMAAIVYHLMRIGSKWINEELPRERRNVRNNYVREFVALIVKHHTKERKVSFYADRLFISSKYLTIIVKSATGHTAAEWIDDYVILSAKKMLRFSGKSIQQVAYELNFKSQSAFGKYFKRLTGLSPTEFQRQ